MTRKTTDTLDQERGQIKRRYRNGSQLGKTRVAPKITDEEGLTEVERQWKISYAIFLKAADYSYSYIADNLNVSKSMVERWLKTDEAQARVAEVREDVVGGALKFLKTYAIEFIEMLAEIARRSTDDAVALRAISEGLDRMGLSKVNKSESVASNVNTDRHEISLTDRDGMLAALKNAPLETQRRFAEMSEQFENMVTSLPPEGS